MILRRRFCRILLILTLFKEKYNNYFSGSREIPSNDFLTWLLGFTEGDGSFVVCNRNDLQFVSTQGSDDVQVLHMICDALGFGKVVKQGKRTSRFFVQDKRGLELIVSFFLYLMGILFFLLDNVNSLNS